MMLLRVLLDGSVVGVSACACVLVQMCARVCLQMFVGTVHILVVVFVQCV